MGLFTGNNNPASKAMPYLNQITPMATQNLNPYIQQGQNAGQSAQNQYQRLVDDPMAVLNEWQAGYTPSAGYQYDLKQGQKLLTNTAAAGGYRGNPNDQRAQLELQQGLLGRDRQQWVENLTRMFTQGLQGQQHVADQGFNATSDLTNIAGSTLGAQSGLAYQGQAQKNKDKAEFTKMLFDALAGAMGAGGVGGGIY